MIINAKLYKDPEIKVVLVDKKVSVIGEFHIDKLVKWRWELQRYLNESTMTDIPDHPDYVVWTFYVDENYKSQVTKNANKHDIDSIKMVVENYYQANVCPHLDVKDIKCQNRKLAEMRYTVMAIVYGLTKTPKKATSDIYKQHRTTALHGIKTVENLLSTNKEYREIFREISILLNEPLLETKILNN